VETSAADPRAQDTDRAACRWPLDLVAAAAPANEPNFHPTEE